MWKLVSIGLFVVLIGNLFAQVSVEEKPKPLKKGTRTVFGEGNTQFGWVKVPDNKLPVIVIDVVKDDFSFEWLIEGKKEEVLLKWVDDAWVINGAKVKDLESFICEAKDAQFSVMCPDGAMVSELSDLFDVMGDNHRVVELINEKGGSCLLEVGIRHGCGVMAEVEPMLVELFKSGGVLNKSEILSEADLSASVGWYVNLATAHSVKGEIELNFGENSKGVTFARLFDFMKTNNALNFKIYKAVPIMRKGTPSDRGLEMLPSSPHVNGQRWIDRKNGDISEQLNK